LINATKESKLIFVPANLVAELASPNIIQVLLNNKEKGSICLIVEDADEALVKRDGHNDSEVSVLLNLTEGILGDLLDIRAICTTNRKMTDIDAAIKRNGRLACHSHLGPLEEAHARKVYERITGETADLRGTMSLADVYALAQDREWTRIEMPKRKLGFEAPKSSSDCAS